MGYHTALPRKCELAPGSDYTCYRKRGWQQTGRKTLSRPSYPSGSCAFSMPRMYPCLHVFSVVCLFFFKPRQSACWITSSAELTWDVAMVNSEGDRPVSLFAPKHQAAVVFAG